MILSQYQNNTQRGIKEVFAKLSSTELPKAPSLVTEARGNIRQRIKQCTPPSTCTPEPPKESDGFKEYTWLDGAKYVATITALMVVATIGNNHGKRPCSELERNSTWITHQCKR